MKTEVAVPTVTVNLVRFTRELSGQRMTVSAKVDNEDVPVNWFLDSNATLNKTLQYKWYTHSFSQTAMVTLN